MLKFDNVKKKATLISAFPGTGKSYLFKNSDKKVLDSDSSKFDKKYFPDNYIQHIKDNINDVDYILISSHEVVRKALDDNNLKFILVYPDITLKDEYLKRYKERGSDKKFIDILDKNWEDWIKQLDKQKCFKRIVLKKDEYLTDYVK